MRLAPIFSAVLAATMSVATVFAQAPVGPKKLAVGKVKAGAAVSAAALKSGKAISMARMTEALDGQLIAALESTQKYEILGRSDADALATEAGATKRVFEFGDADYLLVVSVDDFQDAVKTATFAALGKTVTQRVVRFSAVGKIYDAKTNKIIATANFQEQNADAEEQLGVKDGETSDALLVKLTRTMAEKIAQRVVDIGYPARVVSKIDKMVTINRGDAAGMVTGQLWEVFALGQELIDPDTGKSLGKEEMAVGKVRVTRVNPATSQATILDDTGIDRGAVLRRVEQ
jgi:hypothetical protein